MSVVIGGLADERGWDATKTLDGRIFVVILLCCWSFRGWCNFASFGFDQSNYFFRRWCHFASLFLTNQIIFLSVVSTFSILTWQLVPMSHKFCIISYFFQNWEKEPTQWRNYKWVFLSPYVPLCLRANLELISLHCLSRARQLN